MSQPTWQSTSPAFEYGLKPLAIAVVFVLVALLWTFPLQHWMDYPFVFLFVGAIMGSAWFGGRIAGLMAVVLSSFLVTYCFIPPVFSIKVGAESQSFLVAFVVFAFTVSMVSSGRKRAEKQVREARDLLEEKVQERTAELEQSNREIREREQQLRLLTEAIPQQIWRADVDGSIEYVNQTLRAFLGQREEALLGEGLFQAVHAQDANAVRESWYRARHSGEPVEVQARVLAASSGYRWFLIRVFPQRSETGEIARWYGLHIDIENRQREQETQTRRQEHLSRITRSLSMSEVAASIAHELNQPLTALVTHANACLEWANRVPPNLERVSKSADKIVQESTRASMVVRRVRALFSKDEPTRVECDLNLLVEDSARLLRDEAVREGVKIELRMPAGLPKAKVDPVQIQQVLINLARNGIEAMRDLPGDRLLSIVTACGAGDKKAIEITVADAGPGIPPDWMKDVFEPFFSTKKHGTGIGLAICRSIVEAHSGQICVRNREAGGAVVQVTLPLES